MPTSIHNEIIVIILNWNGLDDTLACLNSLKKVKSPDFDCLIIDNHSKIDPKTEIKAHFPDIGFIRLDHNKGFAGGNNVGIKYAIENNYKYILLLNNDTIVDSNFLTPLVNALQSNEQLKMVQPLIYNYDKNNKTQPIWNAGGKWNYWIGDAITCKKLAVNKLQVNFKPDWLSGCALLIKSNELVNVGNLNEKMFAYYEDVDLSFKMNTSGNALTLVPESLIYHKANSSVNNNPSFKPKEGSLNPLVHFWNARNRIWVIKKYQPWYFLPFNILAIFLYYVVIISYFLIRGRFSKFSASVKGLWQGLSQSMD